MNIQKILQKRHLPAKIKKLFKIRMIQSSRLALGGRCSVSSDDEVFVLSTLQIVAQHGSEPRVTGSIREMFCAVITRQIVLD